MMQGNRFPNTDPDLLWILLAGRKVPIHEWKRWTRVLFGGRKWLPLIACVTSVLFLADMLQSLIDGKYAPIEIALCLAVLAVAVPLMVISFIRLFRAPMKRAMAAYEEYAADRVNQSVRIALYGDYIKMVTTRTETVLRYDEITVYVETEDGMVLGDGTRWIVIRAEDLTMYLTDMVRAYLAERIDAKYLRVKESVRARLLHPLAPIPYYDEVQPFVTETVPSKTIPCFRAERSRNLLWLSALSLGLFLGAGLALWLPFSPWFWLDLACYCAGAVVVASGFAGIASARCADGVKTREAVVSFEPDGLRIVCGGVTRFYVKERVWVEEKTDGVNVRFANGDALFVPMK